MSNVFTNPSWVTNEGLRLLKNDLQFVKNCSNDFTNAFSETPKKGETISVRKQTRFVGRTGEVYSGEDYQERVVTLTVQATEGVDLSFTNRQLMFNFDQFSERVLAPAMMTLANKIDRNCINLAVTGVANSVGTPGAIPTTLKTYNQARAKMSWEGTPQDAQHTLLITPDMQVEAVDAGKGLFQPSGDIGSQMEQGVIVGAHYGAKVYECQNMYTHTFGAQGGTPLTSGTQTDAASNPSASTSTVALKGFTASAAPRLKQNDVITFATSYAVNPWTRQSIGALRQFVVQADVSSAADGTATVTVSPALFASGPLQNITNLPADGSAVTVYGTANQVSPVGLRFHREAFIFGSFDQPIPGGVEIAKMSTDPSTGVRLRFIKDWDTKNNVAIHRFDCVYCFGVAFGALACRIHS